MQPAELAQQPLPASVAILRRLARAAHAGAEERCQLCSAVIPAEHRHLVEAETREVRCVCYPCSVLFDREAASNRRYVLVPDQRLRLEGFDLSEGLWERLSIPVGLVFFVKSTAEGRTVAYYPSPAGATESLLPLSDWDELVSANPVLERLRADVEALLVHRRGAVREQFIVPIDDCYRLVALVRSRWRGIGGGEELWEAIGAFFEALRKSAEGTPGGAGRRAVASGG